jgi:nicotinate-nucleotide adenylyltransferase
VTTGILGGAFDPPHTGHVVLARAAIECFGLDRLLVLVVARPAHKRVETPVEDRLELARAAFAETPLAEVRGDEHPHTVDSLRAGGFDPDETILLVGADQFAGFLTWKEPDAVLDCARLGVATRPGYPQESLEPVLASLRRPERVELFEIPAVDVSSTDLRTRLGRGDPVAELVPPAVARLAVERGLYHGVVDPFRRGELR